METKSLKKEKEFMSVAPLTLKTTKMIAMQIMVALGRGDLELVEKYAKHIKELSDETSKILYLDN